MVSLPTIPSEYAKPSSTECILYEVEGHLSDFEATARRQQAIRFPLASKTPRKFLGSKYDHESWVYILEDLDAHKMKIGRSTDPARRLRQIAANNPHPLKLRAIIPETEVSESFLHFLFHGQRVHGEWFEMEAAQLDLVEQIEIRYLHWTWRWKTVVVAALARIGSD